MSSTTNTAVSLKIPPATLPEDWRDLGARRFKRSISTIEKVVYGQRKNMKIFTYMLELAEKKKAADLVEEQKLAERAKALTK